MHYPLKAIRKFLIIPIMIALLFAAGTAIIITAAGNGAVHSAAIGATSPTLMIDAGHGGLDGGAVSADGVKESSINLLIAQRLCDLCRFLGVKTEMTRTDEELPYPSEACSIREKKIWDQHRRVELVNESEDAVLISIHQNLYPDPRPSGTQVIYAGTQGSAEFAALTHETLRQQLCPENRRVPVPANDAIYLLKSVECPAILVECGFLSNPEEARKLLSPDYQIDIAAILCASYLQFISESR